MEYTGTTSPPSGPAYPLDQGISETCTCHALANAVADQLEVDGIDINQSHVAQILINFNQHVSAVWPHEFHNYRTPIITKDQKTKKWISIKIKTVEKVDSFSSKGRHVLAYYTTRKRKADGKKNRRTYHCVFVKKQLKLQGNAYECVNSWGDGDPFPVVEQERTGNMLWLVEAEWEPAPEGPSEHEMLTKKKIFFIKLDFIGEHYVKEYGEKSSKEFKSICSEIKREVERIYAKEQVHGYESVDVLNIFKGPTTSKNEVDEQNLFIELLLKINTNKSHAIAPLRKQIQKGKLGKYTVAKFLDICEVSLDAGEAKIVSTIYQMQGKHEPVDNITEKLLQKKIIKQDVYSSIKEEKNSLLKAKLFHDVLSKCDNEGLEAFLHELHSSQNDGGFCQTSYGRSLPMQPNSYPMKGLPRGIFLLIVNEYFMENTALDNYQTQGKNIDGRQIALLFQELGFIVRFHENLTVLEMYQVFKEEASINHTGFSAFAACVITRRGDSNTLFYGTDNTMEIKDFITIFNEVPSLKNKPKFLILQFLRGEEQIDFDEVGDEETFMSPEYTDNDSGVKSGFWWEEYEADSTGENTDMSIWPPGSPWFKEDRQKYLEKMGKNTLDEELLKEEVSIPKNADFLVACSSVAGYYELENNEYSSWFINAIIEEFRAHAHKLDVATILTRVNNNVSKCRAKYGKWKSPTNHEKFSNINQLLLDFYLNPMEPLKGYKRGRVLEE